jgi:hypothetical protein
MDNPLGKRGGGDGHYMTAPSSGASGSGSRHRLFNSGVRFWAEIKGALRGIGHGQGPGQGHTNQTNSNVSLPDAVVGSRDDHGGWRLTL